MRREGFEDPHRPEKSLGTLDEAIREHLELKRRQGAGDEEIQQAEAEAFGPGEDDAPGASITAPAGEGDQLDKVFSGEEDGVEAPPTTVLKAEPEATASEASEAGVVVEEEVVQATEAPEQQVEVAEVEQIEVAEVEAPPESEPPVAPATAAPSEPVATPPPDPEPADLGDEADASDLLEAERANLTGHPTENYDVDAAIAEEEELDLLSGSRLSEELDRALGEPEGELPEGLGDAPTPEPDAEVVEELDVTEPSPEAEPVEEAPIEEREATSPLEETPDFLEDSEASDELWFEQGEPKDFDFGD